MGEPTVGQTRCLRQGCAITGNIDAHGNGVNDIGEIINRRENFTQPFAWPAQSLHHMKA
jgi:hypothetical protein